MEKGLSWPSKARSIWPSRAPSGAADAERSTNVRFATSNLAAPLRAGLRRGFAYSDCTVDDSRLVILNAKGAADRWQVDIDGVETREAMGERFGGGLGPAEVDFLVREEWAMSAEDIYWRHTKAGLYASPAEERRLTAYLRSIGQETGIAPAKQMKRSQGKKHEQ
jgi:glycerol-3-phosphate dehydrogenase